MPLDVLSATYNIVLCFVPRDGVSCDALHVDCRTVLGPWVHVGNDETMSGCCGTWGTPEQIAVNDDQRRRWGQESIHVNVLGGNRKNLLKLDWTS
jgi:hypothetical protein